MSDFTSNAVLYERVAAQMVELLLSRRVVYSPREKRSVVLAGDGARAMRQMTHRSYREVEFRLDKRVVGTLEVSDDLESGPLMSEGLMVCDEAHTGEILGALVFLEGDTRPAQDFLKRLGEICEQRKRKKS